MNNTLTNLSRKLIGATLLGLILFTGPPALAQDADPLASWSEGPTKAAIVEFVAAVTEANSKDYVKPADRIATFDNDGTLWVEYPMYTQVLFALERVKELAPQHPEWKTKQPFKALLEGDMKNVGESGMKDLYRIWWRHRIHAPDHDGSVWHPSGSSRGFERRD